jgi:hypothetical protein
LDNNEAIGGATGECLYDRLSVTLEVYKLSWNKYISVTGRETPNLSSRNLGLSTRLLDFIP